MDSDDEEAVAAATAIMLYAEGSYRKRKRIWTKSWIANRLEFGAYHALVSELRFHDDISYMQKLPPNGHGIFRRV
jgi:hypothetical protein